MTNAIDDVVAKIQDHALACTSVTIKAAPDYPTEAAPTVPFCISHLAVGKITTQGYDMVRGLYTVNSDFYFSAVSVKVSYQQMDLIALEFPRRLAGDPTLGAKTDTIVFSEGITFTDGGVVDWGGVSLHLLRFEIPIKLNTTKL